MVHGAIVSPMTTTTSAERRNQVRLSTCPHHIASGIASIRKPSPRVSAARPSATPTTTGFQTRLGRETTSARNATSTKMKVVSDKNRPVIKSGPGRIANRAAATRASRRPSIRSTTR